MITVVTGPPCAGKSTHVRESCSPGALVIDYDAIAQALGYPAAQVNVDDDHPASAAARLVRAELVKLVLAKRWSHGGAEVWLIDSNPQPWQRSNYIAAGATVVDLDPGRTVCEERAAARPQPTTTLRNIAAWYDR